MVLFFQLNKVFLVLLDQMKKVQKKTSCLQNGDSRLIAPCLLYQRCSGIYLYSAKGDILIAPGRSSDSWSFYSLHLPNKLLVAYM